MKLAVAVMVLIYLVLQSMLPLHLSPTLSNEALAVLGRGEVEVLEWSKNGDHLAVGTPHGIWIYNDRLEEVSKIPIGRDAGAQHFTDIKWNAAGDKLIYSYWTVNVNGDGTKGNSVLWDMNQQKMIPTISILENMRFAWHPSKDILLTQDNDEAYLYTVDTSKVILATTVIADKRIGAVRWSPVGKYLALTVAGEGVQIWDVYLEQVVTILPYPEQMGDFRGLEWSKDTVKPQLFLWSDEELFTLDIETGNISTVPTKADLSYYSYITNDYNDKLAFGTDNVGIEIIDLLTGDSFQLKGHKGYITSLVWGPQNYLASASSSGEIFVWDSQTQEIVWSLEQTLGDSSDLAWQSGSFLAVVTPDQLVRLLNVENKAILKTLHDYNWGHISVSWSQDSYYLVASSGGTSREIATRTQVWNVETGELVLGVEQPWTTEFALSTLARFTYCCIDNLEPPDIFWSDEGDRYIIVSGPDAQLWDALNDRLIDTIPGVDCITSVSVGLNYFRTCRDQIWNINTGQVIDEIDRTTEFTWHPFQEKYAVTGEHNPAQDAFEIEIIDAVSQELESTLFFPVTISGTALTLSNTLASEFSWSYDGSLLIQVRGFMTAPTYYYAVLDVQTNTVLATGKDTFVDLEWHPSELIVASPSLADGQLVIEIHEMPSVKLLTTFEVPRYGGIGSSIVGLRWSPNGEYLAIVHHTGTVSIKEVPVP